MTRACVGSAALFEDVAERLHLDRIAERGAGPVRFDVVDLRRLHARRLQRRVDDGFLRGAVRHGQSAARAVLVEPPIRG